jgi:hypothetical protein
MARPKKFVKWLHSPGKKLPGYKYTRESNLLGLFGTSIRVGLEKRIMMPNTAGSHESTVYFLNGSLDSLEYFTPASVWNLILVNSLGSLDLEFTEESQLTGSEHTGESNTNTKNITNIRQNFESLSMHV